jgi:hypothetical protein
MTQVRVAISMHRENEKLYKILLRNPQEKRSLEQIRQRWEDNIKTDPGEIGGEGVNKTELVYYVL